ncbi:MAG: deoxyuridine 5'-triphosphate nucleotidohydrolase [Chloroflexi bacterium]|nr:deoxyuridine 5'-triphosphate nucleotidohydrolase [Chloroflexota bacterium]
MSQPLMRPGVLSKRTLRDLLSADPPLMEGLADLETQLQPQGIDVRLGAVVRYAGGGRIGLTNQERRLPETQPLAPDAEGYFDLPPGPYLVTFAEIVNVPKDMMAFARPRSSLLRCGVALHNAVWDAGYSGRSQALLVVYNTSGFHVALGARIAQMVFFTLDRPAERGYQGRYQRENL